MFYYDIYKDDNYSVKTLTLYKGSYKKKIVLESDVIFFDISQIFSKKQIFALHLNKDLIGTNLSIDEKDMILSLQNLKEKVLNRKIRCNYTNLAKHSFDYVYLEDYKISEITVDKDSLFYSSYNKNLCSKNKKTLIYYHYTKDKKIILDDIYKDIHIGAFAALKKIDYIDLGNVIALDDTLASPFANSIKGTRFILRAKNLDTIKYIKHEESRYSKLTRAILVFNKIPQNLSSFYIVRILHGFMLYKDLFTEDQIEVYTHLLNVYKYDFLIYLKAESLTSNIQDIINEVLLLFNDKDKDFLLKYITLYNDYDSLKYFLEQNSNLYIDAETLGFAMRYRESYFIKLLINYLNKDSYLIPKFFMYATLDKIDESFIDFKVQHSFYDKEQKECFYKERIHIRERLKSIKYLYNALHNNSYFIDLYFFSLCCNEKSIASYLYKQGVRLKNTLYADIIEAKIKDKRRDIVLDLIFYKSYKLVYTYTSYENINITLIYNDYDSYVLDYIMFNTKSLNEIIPYFKFQNKLCCRIIMDLIKLDKDLSTLDLALEYFKISNIDIYLNYAISLNKDKDFIAYLLDKNKKRHGFNLHKLKL